LRQIQTVEAIYENGILRLLEPLKDVAELSKVRVTIEFGRASQHPLSKFAGIISKEEAEELCQIIETEFEAERRNHATGAKHLCI
jgi:predicted DNA-binding antitoxin AbrB/MazE fold protein